LDYTLPDIGTEMIEKVLETKKEPVPVIVYSARIYGE
jgi:hypothetical protein